MGRCLLEEAFEDQRVKDDNHVHTIIGLDQLLKPEYRGHSRDFWGDLQELHDKNYYWNNGLTQVGKECVDYIKSKYE